MPRFYLFSSLAQWQLILSTVRPTVIKNPNLNEHEETLHFPFVGTHESVKQPITKYSIDGPLRKLGLKSIF